MSKTFTAWVTIKEKGTKNTIRLRAKSLSEDAANELQELFVWELLNDPNRIARNELGEGLEKAKLELSQQDTRSTQTADADAQRIAAMLPQAAQARNKQ